MVISLNRSVGSSGQYNEIVNSLNRQVSNSDESNQFKTYQVAEVINVMR